MTVLAEVSNRRSHRTRVARVGTSISLNLILRKQMHILSEEGFDICCVCDPDDWTNELGALGFDVWPIGMGRRPGPMRLLTWAWQFYRALKRNPVQIVHTHNAFHGIVGRIVARLAGVPIVAQTVHNWYFLDPPHAPRARLYRLLERVAGRFSDVVFFINTDDYRRSVEDGVIPDEKRCFIGNGIDIATYVCQLNAADRTSMRVSLGLSDDDVAITMVGRLEPPKDHAMFLEGFARVLAEIPRARALLVGYGLHQESIKQHVRQLGLGQQVQFLGYRDDIAAVLKASDILVLTSRQEGFGRCLVEGMIAGLAVVSTDVVGARDVVRHEQTGLLVPYGDNEALAAALLRLIRDASLAQRLARAGHKYALEHFDERTAALRVGQVYQRLLSERRLMPDDRATWMVGGPIASRRHEL